MDSKCNTARCPVRRYRLDGNKSVFESFLIGFVVKPFENDIYYPDFILLNRIDQPPSMSKIVLPKISYVVLSLVGFRP